MVTARNIFTDTCQGEMVLMRSSFMVTARRSSRIPAGGS